MPKSNKAAASTSPNTPAIDDTLPVGEREVQMDRRWQNRRVENPEAVDGDTDLEEEGDQPRPQRRKKQRRRQIDPTTCERDYNDEEIRFMRAMDDYKRDSGRMFPTCSEILEVVRGLGYTKLTEEEIGVLNSIRDVDDALAGVECTEGDDDTELVEAYGSDDNTND